MNQIFILQQLSQYLGMSAASLGLIMGGCIVLCGAILSFTFARSYVFTIFVTFPVALILGFVGIIPLWAAMLYGLTGIIFVIFERGAESTVDYFSWGAYGKRLKLAYAAKFFGDNSGFDQEVDARIAIMRVMGNGDTKVLAEEWLKKMARFVEIPWKNLGCETPLESAAPIPTIGRENT